MSKFISFFSRIKESQIKDGLSFTSPAFKTETDSSGNVQKYMYQSTFTYVPSQQWQGHLKKFSLNDKKNCLLYLFMCPINLSKSEYKN